MIPDRISLLLACMIAAMSIARLSPSWQQALGVVYSVHALRTHRRALACYVRPSTTNSSSTARCASSIA